jgi:hypothetical protein
LLHLYFGASSPCVQILNPNKPKASLRRYALLEVELIKKSFERSFLAEECSELPDHALLELLELSNDGGHLVVEGLNFGVKKVDFLLN